MKTERAIFKNALFLSGGKVLGDLCAFFFLMYFGRAFGTDVFGKYAFAMSVCFFLTIFISLGLNTLTVREVSKDKKRDAKYIGNLLIIQGTISVLIWGLIGLGAWASDFSTDTKLIVVLIGGYQVFYTLTRLLRSGFIAHEEMQYPGFLEFYHRIFILISGMASIIILSNPVVALAAYPVSAISMFILGFLIYKSRYGWPEFHFDYVFVKDSVIKAMPFFLIIILGGFYDRIGIIILAYLKGEADTGIFSACDRFLVTIVSCLALFSTALFPVMSRFSALSRDKLFKLCERFMRVIIVCLFPLCMAIFILSKHTILITFGEQFVESIQVLRIMSWALLFVGVNQIVSSFFIVTDHQKELLIMRLFVYLGYFIVSLILIWKYSYIGLAWARVISEALLFFIGFFYAYKVIYPFHVTRISLAPVCSCLLSLLLFSFIPDLKVWITIPSVLIVYASAMVILKGIHLHDLIFLKNILLGSENEYVNVKSGTGE
jgi:O-antigen/teichoic acid export membrane protein